MSMNRDFDRIASAWLAEGPSELADRVLDGALREIHMTNQRRGWTVLPRTRSMSVPFRAAVAIAVIAIVSLAGFGLMSSQMPLGSGTATPSPTTASPRTTPAPSPARSGSGPSAPSSSPNIVDTLTWAPFTSTINGFSARFPSDSTVTPATKPGDLRSILGVLQTGHVDRDAPDAAVFDVAASPANRAEISSVSTKLPAGVTADQWLADYRQPIIDASGDGCFPTRDTWESVAVDGQTDGGLYYGCEWYDLRYRSPNPVPDNGTRNYFEAMFFVQGRVYIFQVNLGGLSRFTTSQDFVQSKAADAATRQLLREFLTTVTFDTANAKNP